MRIDWNKFIGMKSGDLEVVSIAYYDKYNRPHYECKCSCGKIFYPVATSVKVGKTKSCGHIRNEKNKINFGLIIKAILNYIVYITRLKEDAITQNIFLIKIMELEE